MSLDEVAASVAFITFVEANEATFVSGISHQGQPREIAQVSDTPLTPAARYYYMLVNIVNSRSSSRVPIAKNTRRPTSTFEYDLQVEISDTALVEQDDLTLEAYMTAHRDFRTFGDRIVNTLREQDFIGTSPRFVLKRTTGGADRRVEKRDLSGVFEDTEHNDVAILYAHIDFTLVSC